MRYKHGQLAFRLQDEPWQVTSAQLRQGPDANKDYLPYIILHGLAAIRVNIVLKELDVKHLQENCKRGLLLEDIASQQKRIWENRMFADATISSSGMQFPVHRAVLAAASPVFERAFSGPMKEGKSANIDIKDSTPAAVEAMLRFIYTGDLELPDANESTALSSSEELVPLISMAMLYEQYALSTIVAELLVQGLTPENAQNRNRALKLHKDSPAVKPAFQKLLQKLREDDTLLEASL
eukprot:gnl/TRDRNA2_/TRDRNA2_112084_c0_seq1.p1 gnl/TRDRNA2_/TRDRNA2_112084_c0~~gnl/TRDRNA2_/TRDRNA2_112084_c0_seq1.p1  ORF type:complete len:252 (+),score=37.33 gnl/TRDRNA2_/TRDRNA2_112084_c0_seq1:45-758(+)